MAAIAAASSSVAQRIMPLPPGPYLEPPALHRSSRFVRYFASRMSIKRGTDFDQLLAFERVAREGSFSRAALAVGIGQPAMSARIRALEKALGGALFTRGRGIALTPLGEGFLPWARRLLENLEEGVEAARLAQQGRRGRVPLGALAGGLVGPALAELIRARPELECVVTSADHEVLVERLLDGVVELALIAWPCSEAVAASLTPLLLLREPVVLAAHPRHAVARRGRI